MKEKVLKIILKLVWFKKIASCFEILTSTRYYLIFAGFYLLGGRGKLLPPNVSASLLPPPPQKKSFPEKNLKLFQIKILFDDDFKESVKVTNLQKCDFSQF